MSQTRSRLPLHVFLLLGLAAAGCSTDEESVAVTDEPGRTARSSSPAHGQIAGTPFQVETSSIQNGILELRQGDGFDADGKLMIFLFLDEGEVPENRTFEVTGDTGFDSPHIHMSWKANDDAMPETEVFMSDYAMRLEFGSAGDGELPGSILLELPDEAKSSVSGSFSAKIEGFRLVDGKPDYTQDALQNLRYLAAEHLAGTVGPEAQIVNTERSWLVHAGNDGRIQTGAADVTYAVEGQELLRRFLFVKEPDAWRVDRILEPNRLAEAHPYREPVAGDYDRAVIAWKVAQAVEAHANERHGGTAIFPGNDYSVVRSYRTGADDAHVAASYRVEGQETPVKMEVRLVRDGDSWRVESLTEAGGQGG